jgi:hypothetical protein
MAIVYKNHDFFYNIVTFISKFGDLITIDFNKDYPAFTDFLAK